MKGSVSQQQVARGLMLRSCGGQFNLSIAHPGSWGTAKKARALNSMPSVLSYLIFCSTRHP